MLIEVKIAWATAKNKYVTNQQEFWHYLWISLLLQRSKQRVQDVWPNCWPLFQSWIKSHSMDPSLPQARWTSAVGFEWCQYWHVLSWLVFHNALDAPHFLSWTLLRHVQRTNVQPTSINVSITFWHHYCYSIQSNGLKTCGSNIGLLSKVNASLIP